MFLRGLLLSLLSLLLTTPARADSATTRDALDRLEEILQVRVDDGRLTTEDVMPTLLVSAEPRYITSEDWFSTRVIEVLQRAFGNDGLRLCEACMVPRTHVGNGVLAYQAGPIGLDEVIRLDDLSRGASAPARSAIWVDEVHGGVSIRIIDLQTGRVIFARNIDPNLVENTRTQRNWFLSQELERRAVGDSVTQSFLDLALYPGQHISVDFTEQWGPTNRNLSGVTLSVVDPVFGIGASHYRALPFANVLIGGKLVLSLPTALVRSLGEDSGDVIDPLTTAVGVVRVPFGRGNYGLVLTASTNGQIGAGISLMNIRLLPVIP